MIARRRPAPVVADPPPGIGAGWLPLEVQRLLASDLRRGHLPPGHALKTEALVSRSSSLHDWQILTLDAGGTAMVIVVCRACGLIRSTVVPNPTMERYIGLGGDCPEVPQPESQHPQPRTDQAG
jgi:hypothetical protein